MTSIIAWNRALIISTYDQEKVQLPRLELEPRTLFYMPRVADATVARCDRLYILYVGFYNAKPNHTVSSLPGLIIASCPSFPFRGQEYSSRVLVKSRTALVFSYPNPGHTIDNSQIWERTLLLTPNVTDRKKCNSPDHNLNSDQDIQNMRQMLW